MPKTPSKRHMYDMVKIDTIVFEIVGGGGGAFKDTSPRIVSCLKYPGSDRVKMPHKILRSKLCIVHSKFALRTMTFRYFLFFEIT